MICILQGAFFVSNGCRSRASAREQGRQDSFNPMCRKTFQVKSRLWDNDSFYGRRKNAMRVTLKDGSVREYAGPMAIIDIAKDLSEG